MSNYELIDHKVRFDPYSYVQIDTEQLEQQVASARFTEVVPMQKKILTAIKISRPEQNKGLKCKETTTLCVRKLLENNTSIVHHYFTHFELLN